MGQVTASTPSQGGMVKKAVKSVLPKPARRALRRALGIVPQGRDHGDRAPELAAYYAIPFFDPAAFPFTAALESHWQEILGEFRALERGNFLKWPVEIYDGEWEIFPFYGMKKKLEENCARCPVTTRVIEQVPGLTFAGFSALQPRSHILPHIGHTSTVLRCHLGLIIPPDCAIRVGAETQVWKEGKTLIIDDMLDHEAWNHNDSSIRVVLLVDFLKQGVTFKADIANQQAYGPKRLVVDD